MDTLLNLVDEAKMNMTDQQYRNIVDKIAALRVEEEKKDTAFYKVLCAVPTVEADHDNLDDDGKPEYSLYQRRRIFIFPKKFVLGREIRPGRHYNYPEFDQTCMTYRKDDINDWSVHVGDMSVNIINVVVISVEKM